MTRLAIWLALLLTSGCATVEVIDPEPTQDVVEPEPEPVVVTLPKRPHPDEYPAAPFGKEVLYELLVAEIAGYRGQYETALGKYVAVAEETNDPGVAARATRLAAYLRKPEAALITARIWAESDPENVDAHRHAADQLVKSQELEEAIGHMEKVKELGGLANFEVFAYRAAVLDKEGRDTLLVAINRMLQTYPEDTQLLFSKAVLMSQNEQLEEALVIANQLLEDEDNINVIILKLNSLRELKRSLEAVVFLQSVMEKMPDNRRLRLIYARFLFEVENLDGAREQYEIALEAVPNDGDVLFALALIAMEQLRLDEANNYLEQMIRWNRRSGEAHYYLGSVAEQQNDIPAAIRHYRQAGSGYEFLPSQGRIAALMAGQGRIAEARDHLEVMRANYPDRFDQLVVIEAQMLVDRGLRGEVFAFLDNIIESRPDNVDLLYYRGMTGEQFDDLAILERDLRKIIELEPENSDALNALGYTLTDQTDRHQEALELIEKALEIKPDEAAYIDSMGWVQYRLGNYDSAIGHLQRALELMQNDEVAAHLGEVLWVSGDQAQARDVWQKALEIAPGSQILKDVMDRLDN